MNEFTEQPWVLIIEDAADWAKTLSESLAQAGFKTSISGTSTDALGKLTRQQFSALVVDMKLERGSGEQIINHIRHQMGGLNLKTPVVVTSGFLEKEMVQRMHKHVHAFLVKPFEPSQLIEKVKEAIKSKH